MRMLQTSSALLAMAIALGGCSRGADRAATADSAAMSSAAPAPAAPAGSTAMAMLPGLRAELDSIAANPSMMHTAMAAHATEVKHVVDAMHADMMAAGMHSDPAYEALADSVVQGSTALATASGADFERRVKEHVDQMRRLAAVYESKTSAR